MTFAVALHADRSNIRHELLTIDKSVCQVVFSDHRLQAELSTSFAYKSNTGRTCLSERSLQDLTTESESFCVVIEIQQACVGEQSLYHALLKAAVQLKSLHSWQLATKASNLSKPAHTEF